MRPPGNIPCTVADHRRLPGGKNRQEGRSPHQRVRRRRSARPPDRLIEEPGAQREARHEHHQQKADILVEGALLRLIGEQEDRLEDDADKSRRGDEQPPPPGGKKPACQQTGARFPGRSSTGHIPKPCHPGSETGEIGEGHLREEAGEPDHGRIGVADRTDVRVHRDRPSL